MSSALCHRILQALWAAGIRDMVVTPGSRSTPLLLAALRSDFRLHSVIDERSAAFFALGRARARGSKVALLCTSGSAGSHYLPALLEARYAGHGVVALTADRPPELQQTGANQTIDQRHLFSSACPPCLEIAVADGLEASELAVQRQVHQAVALAQGPLHINLAFRKPLEPVPGETVQAVPAAGLPALRPARITVPEQTLEELAVACQSAKRGLIVCGPTAGDDLGPAVVELAHALGFALLAESTSGARLCGASHPNRFDAFTHILANAQWSEPLRPDLILQFGAAPASGPLGRWLDSGTARRVRFSDQELLRDPSGRTELVPGECVRACRELVLSAAGASGMATAPVSSAAGASDYLDAWREAEQASWAAVESVLGADRQTFSEAAAMATVLATLASETQLTLGNSLPIRSADAVLPGHQSKLRVLHQRGTSGIEGLIAGTIGSSGRAPSALLLGDVSCSHDLSSLALHPLADGPVVLIVIDNGGGKIFSHLPVATIELSPEQWAFWETPPNVDFAAICKGYGVVYRACEDKATLAADIAWAQSQSSVCMLHVSVEGDSMRSFLRLVQDALA